MKAHFTNTILNTTKTTTWNKWTKLNCARWLPVDILFLAPQRYEFIYTDICSIQRVSWMPPRMCTRLANPLRSSDRRTSMASTCCRWYRRRITHITPPHNVALAKREGTHNRHYIIHTSHPSHSFKFARSALRHGHACRSDVMTWAIPQSLIAVLCLACTKCQLQRWLDPSCW